MVKELTGSQRERNDKLRNKRDRLASYLYTMSQVSFGTMVLAVLPSLVSEPNKGYSIILFVLGLLVTYVFAFFANRVLNY